MTPAERAALRELVARTVDTVLYSYEDTKRIREALPKLLDDCDRLERERDEARELVRNWEDMDTVAWDAVCRWDAEDAQAGMGGKETT